MIPSRKGFAATRGSRFRHGRQPVPPRRSSFVLTGLFLGGAVISFLLAFRILTGLAYTVGSDVAVALSVSGAFLAFRWNAKTR